ncbi:ATP phosphoribosyltransferase regulatory subunit [Congregibacter sp.]|uniref:ATP phosphoribosyltransferase regulatory subunit n=1 Tax=Congregibacter sp. TaxID=2744308 RepID=UPI003F6B289D
MEKQSPARAWQLPDGIDELLPDAAAQVENLRRSLLDCASRWGYRLVMPPMVEFTDSLLVGVGEDLDLLTFKVPDQLTGRMLGLRADITPQVARMDAHSLHGEQVNRLCYAGSTLHTRSESLAASRSPLQLGAELYGAAGLSGDIEVIALMLSMIDVAGVEVGQALTLDLGHGDVFKHVLAASGAAEAGIESAIFDALQRKSRPDLERLLEQLPADSSAGLRALMDMHGDLSVLDRAEEELAEAAPKIRESLRELRDLSSALQARYPDVSLYIDLAELRGYRYHTGVVFAVYTQGLGEALARGGRYDNVGEVYGRARPATGFATDLRLLAAQLRHREIPKNAIAAPDLEDASLQKAVRKLRSAGETVIVMLDGETDSRCAREMVKIDGQWQPQSRRASLDGEGK